MAGWIAFQTGPSAEQAESRWESACAWMRDGKALVEADEARSGAQRVLGFRRGRGDGGSVARSDLGWLALAGQWSHPETRDAEDLLALAAQRGPETFDALDGFFALVWCDAGREEMLAQPDHLGRLHLFEAETPSGVFLATSSVALARCAGAEADPLAVAEFFSCGTMYEERTPFRRVRRLRGGRSYRYREGRRVETLSGPRPVWFPTQGVEAGPDRLSETLGRSLSEAWETHPRLLPDLTGGLDSRLVVGLLRQQGAQPVVTCTGARRDPDVASAARLAARLDLPFRRIDPDLVSRARGDFPSVLRRAARAEGAYDALEYAGIAAIHEPHSTEFEISVNGSGGEMLRNYWWGASELAGSDADPVQLALPRFARTALAPNLLSPEIRLDPWAHFRGVLARSLEGWEAEPLHARLDHLYLDLRMQCWQGSIASATNQIWPARSPLLERAVLEAVFLAPPDSRLGSHLIHRLLEAMPAACIEVPLATGFPPQDLRWSNFWRFVPGLPSQARSIWTRARSRLGLRPPPSRSAQEEMAGLLSTGARDHLRPDRLALGQWIDDRVLTRGLEAGDLSAPLLGRLIALESALRNGSGAVVESSETDRG